MQKVWRWGAGLGVVAALAGGGTLGQNFEGVEVVSAPVRGGIHMLEAKGGNLALLVGDDGALLVDDEFAPLTDRVLAAIKKITDHPVRFVMNTHWHMDHTGGNENMGKAGAVLVAQENVRARMSQEVHDEFYDFTIEASPAGALPVITFPDDLTFHVGGETVRAMHVPAAHTDGDSIVFFEKANVVHMGDTLWNSYYPYIDYTVGGSIPGMIAALDRVLQVIDDETLVIPGHGSLGRKADVQAFREMLATVSDRVRAMVKEGKSAEEIVAAKPTTDFDARYAPERTFFKPDKWVTLVVELVQRED